MDLNQKTIFTQPSKEVAYAGIKEIHRYINKELDVLCYFSYNWNWDWICTIGTYRGKLPNRIAAHIKSYYGLKLTAEQRSMLGNIARKHLCTKDSYTIDFTDNFDWDAGDFGDDGSCFWGDNFGARKVMESEGVIAIRFYDKDGKGFGRAWLYELSSDAWVLFNAYGLECSEAASIFAMFLGEDTKSIWVYDQLDSLEVCGSRVGIVYINNCSQIVYQEGYIPESSIDLYWNIPCGKCYSCENWVYEDDMCLDEEDYETYCYNCHSNLLDEREIERLKELEEQREIEKENERETKEEYQYTYEQAVRAHALEQVAIRTRIVSQLTAGQLCMNLGNAYPL